MNEGVINRLNVLEGNIRYGLMGVYLLFFKRLLVILNEEKNILIVFEILRINVMCMICDNFSMWYIVSVFILMYFFKKF